MSFLNKYYAKFFFKQYTIGIFEDSLVDIIRDKKKEFPVDWLELEHYNMSIADPFLFDDGNDEVKILAELFTTGKEDGKICLITYNKTTGFSNPEIVLENDGHLSYPFIYKAEEKMYVILTELNGGIYMYEFDREQRKLVNKKGICDKPLLDATLLKADDKFWLFGTVVDSGKSDNLHIYYADKVDGPYKSHPGNPVKLHLNGSRPAGNFIHVNGEIYKPSQNCSNYYGESIAFNKIIKLNEKEYEFEEYMTLKADSKGKYKFGIHTINSSGKFVVIDGQRGHFQPFLQVIRAFKRFFFQNKYKLAFLMFEFPELIFGHSSGLF